MVKPYTDSNKENAYTNSRGLDIVLLLIAKELNLDIQNNNDYKSRTRFQVAIWALQKEGLHLGYGFPGAAEEPFSYKLGQDLSMLIGKSINISNKRLIPQAQVFVDRAKSKINKYFRIKDHLTRVKERINIHLKSFFNESEKSLW